jgi:hypothetical protein
MIYYNQLLKQEELNKSETEQRETSNNNTTIKLEPFFVIIKRTVNLTLNLNFLVNVLRHDSY